MLALQFSKDFEERPVLLDNVLLNPRSERMVIRRALDSFDAVSLAIFVKGQDVGWQVL